MSKKKIYAHGNYFLLLILVQSKFKVSCDAIIIQTYVIRKIDMLHVLLTAQENVRAEMLAQLKKTQDLVQYTLGTKFSKPYFQETTLIDHSVMPHAQPSSRPTAVCTMICEVMSCEALTNKRCKTRACARYLCTTHLPAGGHKKHEHFEFKPATAVGAAVVGAAVVDAAVVNADAEDEHVDGEDDDDDDDDDDGDGDDVSAVDAAAVTHKRTIDESIALCQVLECGEQAVHRCSVLNCPFTAVCQLHYMNQHDSHISQYHSDPSKKVRT